MADNLDGLYNRINEQTEEVIHQLAEMMALYVNVFMKAGFTREEAIAFGTTVTTKGIEMAGNK